jgi:hypothetical protein
VNEQQYFEQFTGDSHMVAPDEDHHDAQRAQLEMAQREIDQLRALVERFRPRGFVLYRADGGHL